MAESPAQPMSPNVTRIEMDAAKYRAASQLADGELSDENIAKQAGVTKRQLIRWKKEPAFASLVQGLIGEAADAIRHEAVATKAGRLRILTDLHNKLLQIIEARAERYAKERSWAAGESTGLIVTKQSWGSTLSQEASIDGGLIKELLSLHERIARELGQWDFGRVDVKHSGRIDHVVRVPQSIRNLSEDQLLALEEIAASAIAAEHEVTT